MIDPFGQWADPASRVTVSVVPETQTQTATEVRNAALWITIQRPDALNALDAEVVAGIEAGLDEASTDPAVRCVVITGTGRAFCTGADLKLAASLIGEPSALAEFAGRLAATCNRIEAHPQPVLAAVNGLAMAGGLELLLACDIVIASANAMIADAHANYGLFPGAGATVRLPRRIGVGRALQLLFTGEFASAEDLRAAGLVNEVVAPQHLRDRVQALADTIAQRSPAALRRMKQTVRDGLDLSLADAREQEFATFVEHFNGPDPAEGLAAFLAKRRPDFATHPGETR